MDLAALTPKFAFKNPSQKAIVDLRSFEHKLPVLLVRCLQ